jgi:hypothetical protein
MGFIFRQLVAPLRGMSSPGVGTRFEFEQVNVALPSFSPSLDRIGYVCFRKVDCGKQMTAMGAMRTDRSWPGSGMAASGRQEAKADKRRAESNGIVRPKGGEFRAAKIWLDIWKLVLDRAYLADDLFLRQADLTRGAADQQIELFSSTFIAWAIVS